MKRELWVIETSFEGRSWEPNIDLIYEPGLEDSAYEDAPIVESNSPGLKARIVRYIPEGDK